MHVETSFVRNLGGLMTARSREVVPGQSGKLYRAKPGRKA